MSRKSRENKLNDNMEQLNKIVGDLGRGFDHVQRSIQDALKSTSENVKLQKETLKIFQEQNKIIQEQNDRNFKARQQQRAYDDRIKRQNEAKSKAEKILAEADKRNLEKLDKRLAIQTKLDKADKITTSIIQNNLDNQERINKALEQRNRLYEKAKKQLADIDKAEKRKEAGKNFIQSVGNTALGNNYISKDIDGFGVATNIFSEAVKTFRTIVNEGIDKNYNATEEILNKITASNRMSWDNGSFNFNGKSYSGYKQINNAINDKLWEEGLFDNISNTEVAKATAELTTKGGMGLEQALSKAYDDTVIKYIVPYLDTTSEAFNNLEMIMPRNV